MLDGLSDRSEPKKRLGDNSAVDPPESMPNSEVKCSSADGSAGFPCVRVGHRQALILLNKNIVKLKAQFYNCAFFIPVCVLKGMTYLIYHELEEVFFGESPV